MIELFINSYQAGELDFWFSILTLVVGVVMGVLGAGYAGFTLNQTDDFLCTSPPYEAIPRRLIIDIPSICLGIWVMCTMIIGWPLFWAAIIALGGYGYAMYLSFWMEPLVGGNELRLNALRDHIVKTAKEDSAARQAEKDKRNLQVVASAVTNASTK